MLIMTRGHSNRSCRNREWCSVVRVIHNCSFKAISTFLAPDGRAGTGELCCESGDESSKRSEKGELPKSDVGVLEVTFKVSEVFSSPASDEALVAITKLAFFPGF